VSELDQRVRIRTYREGDGPAICRGFERVFGQPRTREEWAWKHPPATRGETVMIAERDGEVLAHFAALPVSLRVDGRTVRAGQAVDVYSTRRPGVFLRLVDRFYAELCGPGRLELLYGFPGDRHFRLGVRRLRYSQPVPVPFWTRTLGSRDPGTGLGTGEGRRSALRRWAGRLRRGGVSRGFNQAAVEDLWRRAAARYPVAAVRDRGWIGRRFVGRPAVDYRHLLVQHRGRCAALAVVRVADGVLHWAELVWDGRQPETLAALDDEAIAVAREAGVSECRLWLGRDPAAEAVLESQGWRRATEPQDLHVGAVSFLPDLDALEVCRRLYLTMGDADLV